MPPRTRKQQHDKEGKQKEEQKEQVEELQQKKKKEGTEERRNNSSVKAKPELVEGVSFDQVFKWYTVADLRVFLRKHGLSATGKKVELVQRVIDHLNSDHPASSDSETEVEEDESDEVSSTKATKKRGARKQESDVDDEESDVDGEESDEESEEYEESDDESEWEYDSYEADPDLRKILHTSPQFASQASHHCGARARAGCVLMRR